MYVVTCHGQYLQQLERWSSTWVSSPKHAKRYASRAEAELVAFAIEASVGVVSIGAES